MTDCGNCHCIDMTPDTCGWTPYGHKFDTVKASPEIMAAKAIVKEVERVVKLRQAATDKGKTSKATVQSEKIADKYGVSQATVIQAMGAVINGSDVEQVAKLFCKTNS